MGFRWWRTRYLGICPVACGHLVSSRCVVFSSTSIDHHQPGASAPERQSGVSRVDEPANPTPPMDEERRCSHNTTASEAGKNFFKVLMENGNESKYSTRWTLCSVCDRIVFFFWQCFAFSPLGDLLSLASVAGHLVRYP